VHLWPKLLDRGPTEIDPIVHVMESQHEGIEEIITELESLVVTWRATASARSTEDLALLLERMVVLLEEHLAMEEERVLPLIEEYVTAGEWDEMVQAEAADTPEDRIPLLFGMMMYEGDPEVVEKALSQMPSTVRPVVREMSLEAFASHSELVHGTATPRRIKA
jgi:hypothetical protein